VTLQQQFQTLLFMLASGFIVGFFFDGYRVLKNKMNFYNWFVFIIDIFFGMFSALFIFGLLMWGNHGQLRLTIILAFLLGLWIYYKTVSKGAISLWLFIFSFIYSIWKFILKTNEILLIKPIFFLYKVILLIGGFLLSVILAFISFIKKIVTPPTTALFKKTKKRGSKLRSKIKWKAGIRSLLKKLLNRKKP